MTDATPPQVTRTLARYLVGSKLADIPQTVRREATRSILNWMGCAVGGSRHETLDRALAALRPFAGPEQATILGRKERLDTLYAALLTGISSHVFDFDAQDEGVQQIGAACRLVFGEREQCRCYGTGRVDDGGKVRVVEIEDMTGDTVQKGGVQDVGLVGAPQHMGLLGSCERCHGGERAIDCFVPAGADRAAEPIHDRTDRFAFHRGRDIGRLRVHHIARQSPCHVHRKAPFNPGNRAARA
jgi:hypothetical protein